ncbi:hypothetical protein [Paraflavitalea speifideaquila]|uniref:hypothetical protein n=1 Tax=Paraflavitalea speifideaquila TaxID=3076558 RepID=UPI0028F1568E|nr:hypothetical protein [Paraflavitalea speifideiaquila]
MKKILFVLLLISSMLVVQAQILQDTIPPGSVTLAYYEGRTPCQEIMAVLEMTGSEACIKRKIALTLYADAVTGHPTQYKIWGMGMRTGTGSWSIEKGTPTHPQAVVYRLNMGPVSLLLMKADEVLFVLDKQKNFLVGNAHWSYTLNRVMDKQSWQRWRELVHQGLPF